MEFHGAFVGKILLARLASENSLLVFFHVLRKFLFGFEFCTAYIAFIFFAEHDHSLISILLSIISVLSHSSEQFLFDLFLSKILVFYPLVNFDTCNCIFVSWNQVIDIMLGWPFLLRSKADANEYS